MNTDPKQSLFAPPLLLGAAVLFWGWQTGLFLPAVGLAMLLEAPRFTGLRFALQARDFGRFADLCIVLALGEAVYLFLTPQQDSPLLLFGQWVPLTLAPLALAEAMSEARSVTLPAFLSTLRRRASLRRKRPVRFCFAPVFLLATLFAAGCGNTRSPLFYPILALLLCWWLYSLRPRRHPSWIWGAVFCVALLAGYFGQWSLDALQEAVRGWVRRDPFKSSTSIGEIGEIKLSDSIVLRVKTSRALTAPLLLREASYDFFDGQTWHATNVAFAPLTALPESNGSAWTLKDFSPLPAPASGQRKVTVFRYVRYRGALLALPPGAVRIAELPGSGMGQNRLTTVKVERAPALVGYEVGYTPGVSLAAAPTVVDKVVPPKDRKLLARLVEELGIEPLPPREKLAAIKEFFLRNFTYSLLLERDKPDISPLAEFLEHSRKGHCEYFALAAVFLLRQSGVPARYATGYSVQEFSDSEKMYVVRERHAHAWALAHLSDGWTPLDVTPPVWFEEEAGEYTWFERLADLRQRLAFSFARWRWLGQDARTKRILLWTVGPLILFLLYRLARSLRLRPRRERKERGHTFAPVEERLARKGVVRGVAEPLGLYLERAGAVDLLPALRLYYALRFDPHGLGREQKLELDKMLKAWLREN